MTRPPTQGPIADRIKLLVVRLRIERHLRCGREIAKHDAASCQDLTGETVDFDEDPEQEVGGRDAREMALRRFLDGEVQRGGGATVN
jgi:hypothetical protein